MSKIKTHLKRYKETYIYVGAGVLAGITLLIVRKNIVLRGGTSSSLRGGFEGSGKIASDNVARSFSFLGNSSVEINPVVTIHQGTTGNPGFVTRCINTGELFETQKAAARAFDIPESLLSGHLNKGLTLQEGLSFERIGILQ